MTKKSLSLALLISAFAISLPSAIFAMEDVKAFAADPVKVGGVAVVFEIVGPHVGQLLDKIQLSDTKKKCVKAVCTGAKNVATVNAFYSALVSVFKNREYTVLGCEDKSLFGSKQGLTYLVLLALIEALSKTSYAKTAEKNIPYLEKANKTYPWFSGVLKGAGAHIMAFGL